MCLRPKCATKEGRDGKAGPAEKGKAKATVEPNPEGSQVWWELYSTDFGMLFWGKGPGCSELSFRRATFGYILPKDTYGLPPGDTIRRDIFPYLVIAGTQCTVLEMGTVERKGHISDKTAFTSQVLITTFKVFPAHMACHLLQEFTLILSVHQMTAMCPQASPANTTSIEPKQQEASCQTLILIISLKYHTKTPGCTPPPTAVRLSVCPLTCSFKAGSTPSVYSPGSSATHCLYLSKQKEKRR